MSARRPRLKLRGLSRRSRQRIVTLKIYPHAALSHRDDVLTLQLLIDGGSHHVEQRTTHDGLGRQIGLQKTTITAKTPPPAQETTHE